VCTITVALAAAGCESKEARVKRYIASGDAYEAKRQYAEAIIEYRNALKAEPTLADVQLKLGRTYLKAGDAADAVQAMARAADMRPDDGDLQI
jgi:tetratricopeptide (TPR) repeat protein